MTLEIFFVIYESKDSKVWSAIESIAIQRCLRFHHKPQQLQLDRFSKLSKKSFVQLIGSIQEMNYQSGIFCSS